MKTRTLVGIVALIACCTNLGAGADPLSVETSTLKSVGRNDILIATANQFHLSTNALRTVTDPSLRKSIERSLILRAELYDIHSGDVRNALKDKAGALVLAADPERGVSNDADLTKELQKRIAPYIQRAADGEVDSSGKVVKTPKAADHPTVAELTRSDNARPNVTNLPFTLAFVAHLSIHPGTSDTCSGALLAPTLVLTARHCVVDSSGKKVDPATIVVGNAPFGHVQSKGANIEILDTDLGYELQRDVAVIELESPLEGVTQFARVGPQQDEALWVMLAGYGQINIAGGNNGFDKLTVGVRHVVFPATSDEKAAPLSPWTTERFQATQCGGDSGGPVFVVSAAGAPVVVGVLSSLTDSEGETQTECDKLTGGAFVNVAQTYVRTDLCDRLGKDGSPCVPDEPLVAATSP